MLGEGCGRTVCKACAVEYEDDDTTTCFDCYGIPLSVAPRPAFGSMPGSFDFAFSPDEGTATPALSPSPAPAF
ncbi:hypothetical protein AURDEDRAFT_112255 [Auricularia subglabra TFB-10046 SS5]|nr:hypothetical protein AURDEDRAFT_112255 [Auricularia subglabra TFB-10046 SS5]